MGIQEILVCQSLSMEFLVLIVANLSPAKVQ